MRSPDLHTFITVTSGTQNVPAAGTSTGGALVASLLLTESHLELPQVLAISHTQGASYLSREVPASGESSRDPAAGRQAWDPHLEF